MAYEHGYSAFELKNKGSSVKKQRKQIINIIEEFASKIYLWGKVYESRRVN